MISWKYNHTILTWNVGWWCWVAEISDIKFSFIKRDLKEKANLYYCKKCKRNVENVENRNKNWKSISSQRKNCHQKTTFQKVSIEKLHQKSGIIKENPEKGFRKSNTRKLHLDGVSNVCFPCFLNMVPKFAKLKIFLCSKFRNHV